VIPLRASKRFLTWLALAAMWLVVLAPVVSQVRFADSAAASESGWCGTHAPSPLESGHPHAPAAKLCGYCDLFGHSPVLLGVSRLVAPTPVAVHAPLPRSHAPHLPLRSLRFAAPRGPPLFLDA
jgi:hypothetical protein